MFNAATDSNLRLFETWSPADGPKAEPAAIGDDVVSLSSKERFVVVALHEGPNNELLYETLSHRTGNTAMLFDREVYISRRPKHWSA